MSIEVAKMRGLSMGYPDMFASLDSIAELERVRSSKLRHRGYSY